MPTTLPSTTDNTRIYECMVLLSMQLSEKELTQSLRALDQLFEERGGKKLKQDAWGRQGLAFPIKKHREGQYMVFLYELPPGAAQAIDSALRLEKAVLRHLLIKIPKHYEFVTFVDRAAAWEKEKEKVMQEREQEREEALKQKIVHQATKAIVTKDLPSSPLLGGEGSIDEKLTELISDEDLHL